MYVCTRASGRMTQKQAQRQRLPPLQLVAEPLHHRPLFCVYGSRVGGLRERGAKHRHGDDFRHFHDAVGM